MSTINSATPEGEKQFPIDFEVDDSAQSLVNLLGKVRIWRDDSTPWHIDLRKSSYLGANAAAILVALLLESRFRKVAGRITLPDGPPALLAFCESAGLNHFVTGSLLPDPNHPVDFTVAARQIMQCALSDPDPVISLVRRHVGLSDEKEKYLRICINEVIQNVEDHAQSPIGAIMCSRLGA